LFGAAISNEQARPTSNANIDTAYPNEGNLSRNRKKRNDEDQIPVSENKNINFNPSFEPSYQNPMKPQPDQIFDEKKRKNDYGEFLKQQMKQKELEKQREKNENKYPDYQKTMQINNERELEKKRKNEYGEFLRQQVAESSNKLIV